MSNETAIELDTAIEQYDDFTRAMAAEGAGLPGPVETFTVEDGHLVHTVVPRRGKPYRHQCPLDTFEQIAHAVEELGAAGFSGQGLVAYERWHGRFVAYTPVALVLGFLRERGVIDFRHRKNYAKPGAHLDAMTEYHAKGAEVANPPRGYSPTGKAGT